MHIADQGIKTHPCKDPQKLELRFHTDHYRIDMYSVLKHSAQILPPPGATQRKLELQQNEASQEVCSTVAKMAPGLMK